MASILVIEPDESVGQLFETALREAGYCVYRVSSATEGDELLRRTPVEMVITELNLPSGTGLEIISILHQDFPGTKIVGISGVASEFDPVEAAPLLETIEVLPNPVGVTHLVETVQRVLGAA